MKKIKKTKKELQAAIDEATNKFCELQFAYKAVCSINSICEETICELRAAVGQLEMEKDNLINSIRTANDLPGDTIELPFKILLCSRGNQGQYVIIYRSKKDNQICLHSGFTGTELEVNSYLEKLKRMEVDK